MKIKKERLKNFKNKINMVYKMDEKIEGRTYKSLESAVKGKNVFVFGAGGGGDIVGAYYISNKVKRFGGNPLVGSVVWERFSVDPYPGPIPLEMMVNVDPIGFSSALVNSDSYALRYGMEIEPQITKFVKLIGEKAVFIDLTKGTEGVIRALYDISQNFDIDLIIGVDVGGDILALGCEENLWSPLADSISLSALYNINMDSLLAVYGPGGDGELETNTILKYISDIAKENGLIEILGMNMEEAEILDNLVKHVNTEASLIPLISFKGEYGNKMIRNNTRNVMLSPILSTSYILNVDIVYKRSELPKLVKNTGGIGQANQALNNHCIYTELDLENDLMKLRGESSNNPINLIELRDQGIRNLIKRNCNPIKC
ncbi:hypothetical protein Calag_0987 [Caldisphaera lagunensis DSM 15908]|uniref:DUF1152 domain-containing protein n=2 Tax=Caldisphaera lagunensis TaxID=200415 RepID=L0ACE1_CALLD|nr:hypothetical protein Calag_0987 [Caldisphaera lagunensis DSM 15908]